MLEAPAETWILPARGALEPLLSGDLRWPTVQGDEQPLASLHGSASLLLVGDRVHVPWRGPGADAPAELDKLYVQECYTGLGIGARLLRDAEMHAAAAGASTLWLTGPNQRRGRCIAAPSTASARSGSSRHHSCCGDLCCVDRPHHGHQCKRQIG